jgi:hypothetical protein
MVLVCASNFLGMNSIAPINGHGIWGGKGVVVGNFQLEVGHCFFFFLISQNIYIRRKGAQPIVHREYTRESLGGRRETRKEI